jgi:hypothetical protein
MVGISFFATESVMQMSGVKNETQFPTPARECAEECDGVGSARDADGESHARLQKRGVERESWLRRAHERMIVHPMVEFLFLYSSHADDTKGDYGGCRIDHAAS